MEDRLNTKSDCQVEEGIKVILLVEDNVQFYSSYLPMLYTEETNHHHHHHNTDCNLKLNCDTPVVMFVTLTFPSSYFRW